ncbi:MAG: Cyclic di-GMP phosphodiesterase response regulator RpfG [Spirochaetes bacterium ADurb.Bin218]|jgi:HD-GYP domain-containing protein (c-di-GMP phosphodiesterase class II)|nr:MAG: Cyclic di-GMP phosphodiesterase response regulator RpfG [Spirochaetes bacterium ADurb.Bin218]HOV09609.1 HD domain-containing phosphohydrolase [Spirochaetota bacterium]HPX90920.1 HD domain-containing phosphohydrolase [Spirochaetota bacterium]
MRWEKKHIQKTILLDESLSQLFHPDCSDSEKLIITDNSEKTIDYILNEYDEVILFAVIIIPLEKYQSLERHLNLIDYSRIFYQLVIVGDEDDIGAVSERLYHINDYITKDISDRKLNFIIKKSFSIIEKYFQTEQKKSWYYNKLVDAQRDQSDLIDIGRALSGEKDMDKLLRLILYLSKKITGADGGSIYLVEEDPSGKRRLRFKYSHTFSQEIPLEEFVMDMNTKSISGYVAVTGEVLNIPDAYKIDPLAPYSFNPYFDRQHNYISRSMLVVPMKNHLDEIIGVIQLINSKEDHTGVRKYENEAYEIKLESQSDFDKYVVPFDDRYNSLMEAIAGQAAIAIENNRLINQIQKQFEEFVKASVTAIESRDPATSGHSFRVAAICKEMANAINNVQSGYLSSFKFTDTDIKELEFAALLHDFGKVYIDLNIFKKAKKLYPKDLENLKLRMDYLYRYIELLYYSKEMEVIREGINYNKAVDNIVTLIHEEKIEKLKRIIEIKETIIKLNEPTVTEFEPDEVLRGILNEIETIECTDISGRRFEVITDLDKKNLSIKRGSLNEEERQEIESHVIETYKFVSKIPWPPEYKKIPEIALRHHEKLDGTGYPDGLAGRESVSLQSRMMAIADIFDALTAQDRPYKRAVPIERVVDILREEARSNKLDPDLVELFITEKIYEKIPSLN